MKKAVLCALMCAGLAFGNASAAQPLDGVAIAATFNGLSDGVLSLESGFVSNIGHVGSAAWDVEFLTSDALFSIDFTGTGLISIYNNFDTVPAGTYVLSFDFTGLSLPISSFALASGTASGSPLLSIVNSHTASIDLSNVTWSGGSGYNSVAAQLSFAAPVPEPVAPAMLLAGLGVLALYRRKNH